MLLFFHITRNYPIVLRLAAKVLAASHTFIMSLLESCKSADKEAQVHEMQGQSRMRVANLRSCKSTPLVSSTPLHSLQAPSKPERASSPRLNRTKGARHEVPLMRDSSISIAHLHPLNHNVQYPIPNKPSTSNLFSIIP
jgi:hypothetical protein